MSNKQGDCSRKGNRAAFFKIKIDYVALFFQLELFYLSVKYEIRVRLNFYVSPGTELPVRYRRGKFLPTGGTSRFLCRD